MSEKIKYNLERLTKEQLQHLKNIKDQYDYIITTGHEKNRRTDEVCDGVLMDVDVENEQIQVFYNTKICGEGEQKTDWFFSEDLHIEAEPNNPEKKAWKDACTKIMDRFKNLNFDLHFVDKVVSGEMKVEDVPYNTPCEKCKTKTEEPETVIITPYTTKEPIICPKCEYIIQSDSDTCTNCGFKTGEFQDIEISLTLKLTPEYMDLIRDLEDDFIDNLETDYKQSGEEMTRAHISLMKQIFLSINKYYEERFKNVRK